MYALVVIAILVAAVSLYVGDRAVRAHRRARRRRAAGARLAYAAARAEVAARHQRYEDDARVALTSVMPGIHEHGPRAVS